MQRNEIEVNKIYQLGKFSFIFSYLLILCIFIFCLRANDTFVEKSITNKAANIINEIEKLFKFNVLFDLFCIIKHIFINEISTINGSILQKLKNNIPSHKFQMEIIQPFFTK